MSLLFDFATKNLHLATSFYHLVAKWRLNNFFNFEACNKKTLQMHWLIYHPNKLSVYNIVMQFLAYNMSGKVLITIANPNNTTKFL